MPDRDGYLNPRTAEEWATYCRQSAHLEAISTPEYDQALCLICARRYARQVGEHLAASVRHILRVDTP